MERIRWCVPSVAGSISALYRRRSTFALLACSTGPTRLPGWYSLPSSCSDSSPSQVPGVRMLPDARKSAGECRSKYLLEGLGVVGEAFKDAGSSSMAALRSSRMMCNRPSTRSIPRGSSHQEGSNAGLAARRSFGVINSWSLKRTPFSPAASNQSVRPSLPMMRERPREFPFKPVATGTSWGLDPFSGINMMLTLVVVLAPRPLISTACGSVVWISEAICWSVRTHSFSGMPFTAVIMSVFFPTQKTAPTIMVMTSSPIPAMALRVEYRRTKATLFCCGVGDVGTGGGALTPDLRRMISPRCSSITAVHAGARCLITSSAMKRRTSAHCSTAHGWERVRSSHEPMFTIATTSLPPNSR